MAGPRTARRYALPPAVRDFRLQHPDVSLQLHQGSPQQIAQWLLRGEADVGIATEALAQYPDLIALPATAGPTWSSCPKGHALAEQPPTLERLAREPIITYEPGYTGRSHIDEAFAAAGLRPRSPSSAMDADVIKTYGELGLGVGIVASIAFDAERDRGLQAWTRATCSPTT